MVLMDYIAQDTMSYIPLPPDYYTLDIFYPRLSQDEQVNNYGKELINLCIASKLCIVNGRLNSEGGFTCFTPRRNSEVDYIIASESLFNIISNFKSEISQRVQTRPLPSFC